MTWSRRINTVPMIGNAGNGHSPHQAMLLTEHDSHLDCRCGTVACELGGRGRNPSGTDEEIEKAMGAS